MFFFDGSQVSYGNGIILVVRFVCEDVFSNSFDVVIRDNFEYKSYFHFLAGD